MEMRDYTPYSNFIQQEPKLENEFTGDQFLQDYLEAYLPAEIKDEITPDLERFGERVTQEIQDYANACEHNPPELVSFNAWGNRKDDIQVAEEWNKLKKIAAEEGLIAIGYEREYDEYSRLYQFAKLYLFTPSSAMYSCPLVMSDGATRLIEHYGDDYLKNTPFKGLTSRNPEEFLTSGQWMTERTGGSDVSRSMTIAKKENEGYRLSGHKWFTSAITADMAFTLASTDQPKNGKRAPLSLFYMPIRFDNDELNGIEIEALKDKLGSKALPTAQLKLKNTKAKLVGRKEEGVKVISTLFNVTRIYNTITAISYMRRAFAMAEVYGNIRQTFEKKINRHILFQKSLNELEITYESNALLGFFLVRLLGKEDCHQATESEKGLLRLLTPVAELFTAKGAISSASEEIEMFGGLGYLEDTNIPVLLRDAQVLSIWEGTTNVLSLDMLRAIEKNNGLSVFKEFAHELLSKKKNQELGEEKEIVKTKLRMLYTFISELGSPKEMEACARDIAFYLAELTIGLLWLDFIEKNPKEKYCIMLNYWLRYKMDEKTLDSHKYLYF